MTGHRMDGRRQSDWPSPGFLLFIVLAMAAFIMTFLPASEIVPRKPNDACRDGIVQQFDGKDWHPVVIDRPSRHYDGKKWVSDYPKGYQRTIPCKG